MPVFRILFDFVDDVLVCWRYLEELNLYRASEIADTRYPTEIKGVTKARNF